MSLLATAANLAWWATCKPAHRTFAVALHDPRRAQLEILRDCVARNADTSFGRAHRFEQIDSIDSFRRRLPLREYEELEPWITAGGLTAERVLHLTPTSGSTGAKKRIPFTASLQRQFNAAIGPWIADLFTSDPSLAAGCAYWSITPPPRKDNQDAFDDDAAYLGGARKRLVEAILAVPARALRGIRDDDIDGFRRITMRQLLLRRDLRLISIWHPSFLELLLDYAETNWHSLCDEIERTHRPRARQLRAAGYGNWRAIWPDLALISCWTDAHAARSARALARRLPHVRIQPKGLLATEGFISIPFASAHPLAVRSHLVEFIDLDDEHHSRPCLADELRIGGVYTLALTTAGGLYRYRLHDRVRVEGFVARTPSLRFEGRDDATVDRFGEKLHEQFVSTALERTMRELKLETAFALLAPDDDDEGESARRYLLFIQHPAPPLCLAPRLDEALQANPQYACCRALGQLEPVGVVPIGEDGYQTYAQAMIAAGQRLGDIKPAALSAWTGWMKVFASARSATKRQEADQFPAVAVGEVAAQREEATSSSPGGVPGPR